MGLTAGFRHGQQIHTYISILKTYRTPSHAINVMACDHRTPKKIYITCKTLQKFMSDIIFAPLPTGSLHELHRPYTERCRQCSVRNRGMSGTI